MREYGLIGYPLSHSFSERFFTEKFRKENIGDARYNLYPLKEIDEFTSLHKALPDLVGLNVTIPYKQTIIPFLDEIDEEALQIGAVNCLHRKNGKWKGYNTDVYGFRMSIKPFLENKFERALILGDGGGAKAVMHVLKSWNIPFHVVSRRKSGGIFLSWSHLTAEMVQHFKLIIHTTPVGMFPNIAELPPFPYDGIGQEHFLYDLIYNPEETGFLREGRVRGALTMNGLKMLEWQAIKSWEIWNC